MACYKDIQERVHCTRAHRECHAGTYTEAGLGVSGWLFSEIIATRVGRTPSLTWPGAAPRDGVQLEGPDLAYDHPVEAVVGVRRLRLAGQSRMALEVTVNPRGGSEEGDPTTGTNRTLLSSHRYVTRSLFRVRLFGRVTRLHVGIFACTAPV